MEILSDPTPDMLAMPRFDDGAIDMQELLRRLAEQVVNAVMDAEADHAFVSNAGVQQRFDLAVKFLVFRTYTGITVSCHFQPPALSFDFLMGMQEEVLALGFGARFAWHR